MFILLILISLKNFVLQNSGIDLSFEQLNAFFQVANAFHQENLIYQDFVSLFFPYGKYYHSTEDNLHQQQEIYIPSYYPKERTNSLPRLEPVQILYSPPKRLDQSLYQQKVEKYSDLYENLIEQRYKMESYKKKQVQFSDIKSTHYSTPLKEEKIISKPYLLSSKSSKQSPMKQTEESQLVRILKEQIILERELEESRKQLILKNDFNLLDGFRIIDEIGKGFVTSSEFKQALDKLNVFTTDEQIYLFFRRYDKDQDGLLRYSDFCRFCIPLNKLFYKQYLFYLQIRQFAKILNDRPPFYQKITDTFSSHTLTLFAELFRRGLAIELAAEGLRKSQTKRKYFHLSEAFTAIDKHEKGFITLQEFKDIFNDYGIYASKEDLVALVKRYDQNMDGKVSYSEFVNEMTQKTPTKY